MGAYKPEENEEKTAPIEKVVKKTLAKDIPAE